MVTDDTLSTILRTLLTQSPVLLVCLAGTILALVLCPRCPAAGVLLLIGTVVLLMSSVGWPFLYQYLIHSYSRWGWSSERLSEVFTTVSIVSSFVHAAGIGLIIAAVFVGRRQGTS
jgi:hypothetical protein